MITTIVNNFKEAFGYYKKGILPGIIYSILSILIGFIIIIPLIGPIMWLILYSYLFPRITSWYLTKILDIEIKPNHNVATKILFIVNLPTVISYYIVLFMILSLFSTSIYSIISLSSESNLIYNEGLYYSIWIFIVELVSSIAQIILVIIWYYNIIGAILGKVDSLKVDIWKSLEVVAYNILFVVLIIPVVLILILLIIFSPIIGLLLLIIFVVFFVIPYNIVLLATVVKNISS
ncbi:MAG: hypothetical protein ACP5G1_00010 [Nanopusillaceae archaeon]